MSDILQQVIERASTDAAFRDQLRRDPESALAGYALTAEERAAILHEGAAGRPGIGLDARVTKLDNPPGPGEVFDASNTPWS